MKATLTARSALLAAAAVLAAAVPGYAHSSTPSPTGNQRKLSDAPAFGVSMRSLFALVLALLAATLLAGAPSASAASLLAQGSAPETGWARGSFVVDGGSEIRLTINFSAVSPEAVALMSLEYPSGSSSTMTYLWDDQELVVHSDVAGIDVRSDSSQVDDAGSASIVFECDACHSGKFSFLAMTAGGIGAWSWKVTSDRATAGPVESGLGRTFIRDASDFEGPANVALTAYTGVAAAVSTRVVAEGGLWARFYPEPTLSGSAVGPDGERACPCIIGKALAPAAPGTYEFRATGATSAARSGSWLYGVAFPLAG